MACDPPGSAAHFWPINISPSETLNIASLKAVLGESLYYCYEVMCQEEITAIKM